MGTPGKIAGALDSIAGMARSYVALLARHHRGHGPLLRCSACPAASRAWPAPTVFCLPGSIAGMARSYGALLARQHRGYRPFISFCINWLAVVRLPLHAKSSARHCVKFSTLFSHPAACAPLDSLSYGHPVRSLEQFAK